MIAKDFGILFNKFTVQVSLIRPGDKVIHHGYSFTLNDFAGYTYWDYDPAGQLCIGVVFNVDKLSEEIMAHESWHLTFRMLQAMRENPSAEILGSEIWAYTFEDIFHKVRSAVNEMISKEET